MFTGGQSASIGASTKLGPAARALVNLLASADSAVVSSNPASQFAAAHLSEAVYEGGNTARRQTREAFGPTLDEVLLGRATPGAALEDLSKAS